MKSLRHTVIWLLAFFLAACNLHGVASFSPNNDRVAIIIQGGNPNFRLETTDNKGGNPIKIDAEFDPAYDVTFDPLGLKLLYVKNHVVCTVDATGGNPSCPVDTGGATQGKGFLSFLPNGDYVLVSAAGQQYTMGVYQPGAAQPYRTETNVDYFFLTSDVYKVKRGTNGTQWYLTLYTKPRDQQNLRWVIVRGPQVFMYNATNSLEGPTLLPNGLSSNVQSALKERDQADITSGVISPDGTKMAFRTRTGTDPNFSYGLYVLDLSRPGANFVPLVSSANFNIQFAFSPTSQELAYESNIGGRSLWLTNSDGSNQHKLADNASLPDWH